MQTSNHPHFRLTKNKYKSDKGEKLFPDFVRQQDFKKSDSVTCFFVIEILDCPEMKFTKFHKERSFSLVTTSPKEKSALYVENHPYSAL